MSIEKIMNVMQVTDRIASSGQPEANQFSSIAAANYRVVINLAMPDSDNAIPNEGNIVADYKMTYIHIPVPFESPNTEHLSLFIKIMSLFYNEKIWVHCAVNYRVSAFLYQYFRLSQGYSDAQAKKAMHPSWHPNKTWQQFMSIGGHEITVKNI